MNEQFKELLAKHIAPPALAVDRDLENQHTAHVTYTVSQAEMNNLLEAVVEECLSVVYDPDGTDYGSAHDIVYADIESRLKEHFGVREQTESQKMADAGYTRRSRGWTKEGTE